MKYIFLFVIFFSNGSYSLDLYDWSKDENCLSGSGSGGSSCMRAAYKHYQKQIDNLMNNLNKRLEVNYKNLIPELQVSQRLWLMYVKSACAVEIPYFRGTIYAATVIGCEVEMQKIRIKYLEKVISNARQY